MRQQILLTGPLRCQGRDEYVHLGGLISNLYIQIEFLQDILEEATCSTMTGHDVPNPDVYRKDHW